MHHCYYKKYIDYQNEDGIIQMSFLLEIAPSYAVNFFANNVTERALNN